MTPGMAQAACSSKRQMLTDPVNIYICVFLFRCCHGWPVHLGGGTDRFQYKRLGLLDSMNEYNIWNSRKRLIANYTSSDACSDTDTTTIPFVSGVSPRVQTHLENERL
jgi:hypothetical protein